MPWCVLTDSGLYQITLSELKFKSKVKNWFCNADNYIYNVIMNEYNFNISNTICRSIENYKIKDFIPVKFTTKYAICPNDNCFCGLDIGIPKGKTIEDIIKLRQEYNKIGPNLNWYEDGEIKAMGWSNFLVNEIVHIDWFLGKRCNFDCWYCPSYIHDNFSPYPNLERLLKINNYILDIIKSNEKNVEQINYIFHGGEPTLIPCYIDFLKTIKKENVNIRTLTNLTLNKKKLLEINKYSDLTFSVHLKYMTPKFIKKVEEFLSIRDHESQGLTVKFMYDPEYNHIIDKMLPIINKYENLDYSVTPLHNKADKLLYEYNDNDKKYFKIQGNI